MSPFDKVCTGGRIRLFWGVSPDLMAIALTQVTPAVLYSALLLWYSHKNKAEYSTDKRVVLLK